MRDTKQHANLLKQLLGGEAIRAGTLDRAPSIHGAYVLWLDGAQPVCLKIGIANPGRRDGVHGRLRNHFASNPNNTVLARHMAADCPSWAAGFDLASREERRRFLASRCYVQTVALPKLTRSALREFERYIEDQLQPLYCGVVGKNLPPARPRRRLILDEHDEVLVAKVRSSIHKVLAAAHARVAVTKRIHVLTTRERNRGRAAAIRRTPFRGICEASGLPLDPQQKRLDEIDPELGYAGRLRWVCPKANNDGKHSCGGC